QSGDNRFGAAVNGTGSGRALQPDEDHWRQYGGARGADCVADDQYRSKSRRYQQSRSPDQGEREKQAEGGGEIIQASEGRRGKICAEQWHVAAYQKLQSRSEGCCRSFEFERHVAESAERAKREAANGRERG